MADDNVEIDVVEMTTCTTSTSTADDFAHRGKALQAMPFYVYRMHVFRQAKKDVKADMYTKHFDFEPHYVMSKSYTQVLELGQVDVPTIDGFQCPTWHQDPKQNSLLKAILLMKK